jgi:hypothetical protein
LYQKLPNYTEIIDGAQSFILTRRGQVRKFDGIKWKEWFQLDPNSLYSSISVYLDTVCVVSIDGAVYCNFENNEQLNIINSDFFPENPIYSVVVLPEKKAIASGSMLSALGPFMQYPILIKPSNSGFLSDNDRVIKWQIPMGKVSADYYSIGFYSSEVGSFWYLIAGGEINSLEVPSYLNFPGDMLSISITRAHSPGFDINYFKYNDLSTFKRDTWSVSYNTIYIK